MSSSETYFNEGLSQHLIDDDLIDANDINIRKFQRKTIVKISASIAIILAALIIIIIIIIIVVKKNPHSSMTPSIAANRSIDLIKQKQELISEVNLGQMIGSVVNQFYDLSQWKDYKQINLLGKTCTSKLKGGFHQFKWVWISRFECDGIVGESARFGGRDTAIKNAIADYLIKTKQVGLVTIEQLEQFG